MINYVGCNVVKMPSSATVVWPNTSHDITILETSHATEERDAAGSRVKQKVSQAVPHRTATINSAESIHQYLVLNFSQPAASSFMARATSVQLKRCVFFYISAVGEGAGNRIKG